MRMRKGWKLLAGLIMFLFFAALLYIVLVVGIGAVRCVYAIVTEQATTFIERIALVTVLTVGGAAGTALWLMGTD